MASIVAPKLDLPTTPAHEWANQTSSELQTTSVTGTGDSTARPPMNQTVSTPGVEVPGSYPRGVDAGAQDANIPPPGRILDMAKQYLPAQEDVQGVLKNATETAKQYLPQSVAAYLPGGVAQPTSLPSQEGPQKPLEHSDGVGSLPGNASEASVAKLPDEREENKDTVGDAHKNHVSEHSGGVGSLPGGASEVAVAKLPEEKEQEKKDSIVPVDVDKKLPVPLDPPKVQTTAELTPATNGAMKETVSSASIKSQIAETPLVTPGLQTPAATAGPGGLGGVGELPGDKSESNVAVLPDERKEQAIAVKDNINGPPGATLAAPRTAEHTDSTVAVSGHDTSPTSPLSGSKFTESPSSKNKDKNNTNLTSTTSAGSNETDASRSTGGTPRKPKLMDKIKGEVKVITGKLGGKEDKVEEGRRLMGKV